eukprot:12193904-Alexandrium_andersonii.AAC.1
METACRAREAALRESDAASIAWHAASSAAAARAIHGSLFPARAIATTTRSRRCVPSARSGPACQ